MAKTSAVPDVTVREESRTALKEIKKNPDLTKVFERISEKFQSLSRTDILGRYEIGREVAKVMEDENRFGSGAVIQIAKALSLASDSELYRYKGITDVWTIDEVKKIIDRSTSAYAISTSHLTSLATVPKESLRAKLLDRCFKESLTVRALVAIMQQKLGVRGNNPNGRRAKVKSPSAGTIELNKITGKWLDMAEAFEEMVCEPLDKKAEEYATEELSETLADFKKSVENMQDIAEGLVAKVESAHQKVSTALEAAASAEETATAEKAVKKSKKLKLKLKKGKKKLKLKKKGKDAKTAIKKAKEKASSNGDAADDDVGSSE